MQRLQALRRTNRVAAWLERNRQAAGDWDGSDGDSASRSARLAQLLAALAGDGLDVEAASQRLDDLAWLMGRLQQVPGSRESLAAALAEASALRPDPDGPSRPPPPPGAVAAASPSTFRDSGAGGGSAGEAAEEPQRSLSTRKLAVTHRGLERARSTMQDFVQSYFMFHGLDPANPADVFRYLPDLLFVEGRIYDVDEENEDAVAAELVGPSQREPATGASRRSNLGGSGGAGPRPLDSLREFLRGRKLLTDRIAAELDDGEAYWELERRIGSCLARARGGSAGGGASRGGEARCTSPGDADPTDQQGLPGPKRPRLPGFDQADAERALTLKSFDYRVLARNPELSWIAAPQRGRLPGSPAHAAGPGASRWAPPSPLAAQNLLLYALRGAEPDPLALAFLAESEVLVEAADDLLDYEDDVLRNAFNVFRCLVHLHGAEGGAAALAELISRHEGRYAELMARLDPEVARAYQARCQEATRAGGGTALGTWTVPGAIVDEDAFRRRVATAELVAPATSTGRLGPT